MLARFFDFFKPKPRPEPSVCADCRGTGFSDKVGRGAFSMDGPVCIPCLGSGWLNRRLK